MTKTEKKNHMKDVANLLGVELYEEFMLTNKETPYRLTEKNLELYVKGKWVCLPSVFESLLNGKYHVIKKPWKPKRGDRYFIPLIGDDKGDYAFDYWADSKIDINRYKVGIVCKTREEAIKKVECMLQALQNNETEE